MRHAINRIVNNLLVICENVQNSWNDHRTLKNESTTARQVQKSAPLYCDGSGDRPRQRRRRPCPRWLRRLTSAAAAPVIGLGSGGGNLVLGGSDDPAAALERGAGAGGARAGGGSLLGRRGQRSRRGARSRRRSSGRNGDGEWGEEGIGFARASFWSGRLVPKFWPARLSLDRNFWAGETFSAK